MTPLIQLMQFDTFLHLYLSWCLFYKTLLHKLVTDYKYLCTNSNIFKDDCSTDNL